MEETLDFAKVTWTSPGTAGGEQRKATGRRKAKKNERSKDGNFFFHVLPHFRIYSLFIYLVGFYSRNDEKKSGRTWEKEIGCGGGEGKERTRRLQRKRVRKLGDSIVPGTIDDSQRKRVIL